jgi:hypothetical protein
MTQAEIVYHHNQQPRRGLALAGALFGVKAILLIPHLIIVNALQSLAMISGYIGFWIVALTGKAPAGLHNFVAMWLRWGARSYGWLAGITDEYPPFESEPQGFPIDAVTPANESPSKGWAVAGIFLFPKGICLVPHFFLLFFAMIGVVFVTWWGYVMVFFTGRFPTGMQDFIAGTMQWYTRVMSWFLGLTDEYPPYGIAIRPAA